MVNEGWTAEQFREKYLQDAAKVGRFNLAIFGKTGVGKSTLINAVFGDDVAPTGIGEPVTMDGHLYLHPAGFLGLYDTRGLEIGTDTDTIIAELERQIRESAKKPLREQIHAAWYCVRASDRRFEDTEADFIRRLHELGLPVIVVLTQVPARAGEHHADALALARHIAELGLPIAGGRPILVMASGDEFTGQAQHGLNNLLDATFQVIPEGVENALVAAQKVDLDLKRKQAAATISVAVAASAAVGATPIPIADAALLVPVQLGMITSITIIYGVKFESASIAAALVPAIATNAGRAAVTGLLKLIPGAGTLVGGLVSAGTAGVLTGAMGYAWAAVCHNLVQGKLKGVGGLVDSDAVRSLFRSEFKTWFSNLTSQKSVGS